MNFFRENKTVLTGILVVVLVFGGYIVFFRDSGSESDLLVEPVTLQLDAGADLVALLLELRSLNLNPAIFSNQAFQSLQDFSVELVPEPTGRRNPFASAPAPEDVELGGSFDEDDTVEDLEALLEDDFSELDDF